MSLLTKFFGTKYHFCCVSRYSTLSTNKQKPKSLVRHKSWVRQNIVRIIVNFTYGYERILEKRFPSAFKVYRIFVVGSQTFYQDVKEFVRIATQVRRGRKITELNRREIEIYYQAPKEIIRVTPILFIAALPFVGYIVFPLAYLFPRQLLSYHFWSLQQRTDFALIVHKKKLYSYKPVFRYLQAKAERISDARLQANCMNIIHKIGSGVHPLIEEILEVKSVFEEKPYRLNSLSPGHVSALCRIHGLSSWGWRLQHLRSHALMITYVDAALRREKISSLNADDMRKACFLRGVNPINMPRDSMVQYLEQWIAISNHVTKTNYSLLLHCPIFLAYNQPTNWSLIH